MTKPTQESLERVHAALKDWEEDQLGATSKYVTFSHALALMVDEARDAALEEAANIAQTSFTEHHKLEEVSNGSAWSQFNGMTEASQEIAIRIRALKSKAGV